MGQNRAGCSDGEVITLGAYDEARRRGEKHVVSISEAVSAVRDCDSKMPISETEVRRILACWRSKTTAAGTILPEPVKILEGPAAEGIHEISSASLPSNCNLSWAESSI